jgi:protocatechuate 3,4-dioxygenase beta subunit
MGRREVIGALGAAGAAFVLPARAANRPGATVDCVVVPEMTEGPFFVDEKLERSDLTAGTNEPFVTAGLPLLLEMRVFQVNSGACAPLVGSRVDVWHASAEGVYSDERSGRIQDKDTVGETYLRGYQRTDANGAVTFATIYPGWYAGRTVHIHFKIRGLARSGGTTQDFTSQLFFDDAINDAVLARPPYNKRGSRRVRNSNDGIYRRGGGSALLLAARPAPGGKGYAATLNFGLRI